MKAIIDAANSNRCAQSPAGMVKRDAKRMGARDNAAGLVCDPGRHGAMTGSAWAKWYTDGYRGAS